MPLTTIEPMASKIRGRGPMPRIVPSTLIEAAATTHAPTSETVGAQSDEPIVVSKVRVWFMLTLIDGPGAETRQTLRNEPKHGVDPVSVVVSVCEESSTGASTPSTPLGGDRNPHAASVASQHQRHMPVILS